MTQTDTAALVKSLQASAIRHATPCGDGHMIWMEWGSGEPVVLIHGGSGSWRHWLRNIEPLAEKFRVIAADVPGYHDSALPHEPVNFTTIGQAMAAGLDRILGEGEAYHMAGFSLGSFIAPHVIAHSERRAKSLALVHGHLVGKMDYSPSNSLKRWRNVEDIDERREILRHNLGALMLAHPESADASTIEMYREDVEKSRLRVPAFIDTLDTDILLRLDARICSISGRLDPTALPDVRTQVEKLQELLPAAQTHVIENAGHWVMFEAAAEFNKLVLDWLVNNS
ncbi:MAG: alpha/beta hydrolase [Hyphomicrobiales bacterium]|nr:alpha/beta hydrolase [Hyphomicrobiales bacterium]